MEFKSRTEIILDRELSDLDTFVIDFVSILEKHVKYVLISGYVSILLGRSRSSEDVDIFIERVDKKVVDTLVKELNKKFYCINSSNEEVFEVLNDNIAVRFAYIKEIIPNMEMKFIKNPIDKMTLDKKIKVNLNGKIIYISELEMQIAYKEKVLKSEKDIEDARHLRIVASKIIDEKLIKKYELIVDE